MSIAQPCYACGHRHEGPGLAGICVGCPCEHRAAERGLTVHQVDYLRRALVTISAPTADPYRSPAGDARRSAYRHALTMLDELLAEPDLDSDDRSARGDGGWSTRLAGAPPADVFHHDLRPNDG